MRLFALLCILALTWPVSAFAQDERDSTPIVIHPGVAGQEGVIAERRQIILRQRLTTIRAVTLDAPVTRPMHSGRQVAGADAGESLFGVYDGYGSWSYCLLSNVLLSPGAITCYQDRDNDGRLETAMDAGMPFGGVPFFIFANLGEARPLPFPAAYHRISYADGPSIEVGVQATYAAARTRRGAGTIPANVTLSYGYIVRNRFVRATATQGLRLDQPLPATLTIAGARIELSGGPDLGALHYRIIEPVKPQLRRVRLRLVYY